jgi:hypothetical protein
MKDRGINMAVDFSKRIIFDLSNIHNFLQELRPLPDKCPICKFSVSPEFILIHNKLDSVEVLCGCPRNECGSLFFAVYQGEDIFTPIKDYVLSHYYPYSRENKEFSKEVMELSPDFVAIFNQAHHAEQEGLDLICGVGYRKALEYLIKEFVIYFNLDETEKIKRMPLQQCIQQYINQPDIKEMAERAVWLGNDETHYVRKWEDKDIQDLKNLIDLTVYFISMTLKAEKYREEMVR